ncbi:MAG: universal stress protein [Gemmatimonadetes bacterium]|nr:universal stress protein [Gemmatimonadota bacterium]
MTESSDGRSDGKLRSKVASIRSILVATDLSDGSDALLRVAAEVAVRSEGAVHVAHAAAASLASAGGTRGTFADAVALAEGAVDDQIRRVMPPTVRVDRYVEISPPDRVIVEHGDRVDAELIVVGPHVRRAGPARLLGSTAERVLSTARVPCLVVRTPLVPPLRDIVAAVDPAHLVGPVLDAAIQWALLFSGGEEARRLPRLSALYVTSQSADGPPAALDDAVRSALARSGEAGRVNAVVAVRGTDVVESILLYVEAEAADLLVLSTRNRGLVGRALLGSVSAEVTRRAPCNVLLVPPGLES